MLLRPGFMIVLASLPLALALSVPVLAQGYWGSDTPFEKPPQMVTISAPRSLVIKPSNPNSCVESIDYSACPSESEVAHLVLRALDNNYAKAREMLGVPDDVGTGKLKVVLHNDNSRHVSETQGNTLYLNANYMHEQHKNSVGCAIWQMVIVFYENLPHKPEFAYKEQWFLAACADVVRARAKLYDDSWCAHCLPDFHHYDHHSQCGAAFLLYLDAKYKNVRPIQTINIAIFAGNYSDHIWQDLMGKDLEALWQEYLSSEYNLKKQNGKTLYVAPDCINDDSQKNLPSK